MADDDDLLPSPEESLDKLAGDWKIFQLVRGHRFSTDDLACAWHASQGFPTATRLLDLGCGIGSVGLTTLWRLGNPRATLVGVEAQEVSASLAKRSVRVNGLADRVTIVNADLRDPDALPASMLASFELVTGSPPYLPLGTGLLSPIPQRAGARIELRGSIYDYSAAARRYMAPGGRFCFVMAAQDPRTEDAPRANGLTVLSRWEYVFRDGRAPHIATLLCARDEDGPHPPRQERRLVIRDAEGRWTPEYMQFRREMGAGELR